MGTFVLPLLVFALVGGLASAWLFKVRERREQISTGLMALSAMHWRELQRLVVSAMQQRGYHPLAAMNLSDDEGLVGLQRDGRSWLLSTKHGTAYVLGTAAVGEFANAVQLHGAHGGIMATVGDVAADTRTLARTQHVEVLDGRSLWAEVSPLMETEQRNLILSGVHARTRRHAAIAWGIALVAAVLAFMAGQRGPDETPTQAAREPAARSAPPTGAASTPAEPAVAVAPMTAPVPEDPAALAERRRKLALAVGTLPWVARAVWSTPSTLVIDLHAGASADKAGLCKKVEAYPELRASRLQLQAPGDAGQPVRFMQCQAY